VRECKKVSNESPTVVTLRLALSSKLRTEENLGEEKDMDEVSISPIENGFANTAFTTSSGIGIERSIASG